MGLYESFRTFLAEYGLTEAFDMAFESQHPGYRLDATLWDIMGSHFMTESMVVGRAKSGETYKNPKGIVYLNTNAVCDHGSSRRILVRQ